MSPLVPSYLLLLLHVGISKHITVIEGTENGTKALYNFYNLLKVYFKITLRTIEILMVVLLQPNINKNLPSTYQATDKPRTLDLMK